MAYEIEYEIARNGLVRIAMGVVLIAPFGTTPAHSRVSSSASLKVQVFIKEYVCFLWASGIVVF